MLSTALSLVVLSIFGLVLGAYLLWRRQGAGRHMWLMLALAAVMAVNLAIWTLPDASGNAPLGQALK